ncbi:LutC/YkgG family protein [Anaeromyxobacter diazotrophicus]|nr:LUD domain-containing protein [Anaeromyxobacter diazotrophicus]
MTAREEMLAAMRRNAPRETPRPDLARLGVKFADPAAKFAESLQGVGGTCLRVPDLAVAGRAVAELPVRQAAKKVVSLVPEVEPGNLDLAAVKAPRELEGLDLTVLRGELAVAENGAVWVDAQLLPHRAIFVIAEHLVLVVDAAGVVNDLHEAYARLAGRPAAYGLFISGPSKTADIEQALVIGAQGARSCTVLLVG